VFKNRTSGSKFAFPEWLKSQSWVSIRLSLILLLTIAGISRFVQAQGSGSSISAYADAIKQSTISERITAMDRYVAMAGGSKLKMDALEFLVWDHVRLGHQSQSTQRAKELLAISPGFLRVAGNGAPAYILSKGATGSNG